MSQEKIVEATNSILKNVLTDAVVNRGTCMDFNDPSLCGIYLVTPLRTANFPSEENEYGTLIVFKGYYTVQVYIPNGAVGIYIRTYSSDGGGVWRPWRVVMSAALT